MRRAILAFQDRIQSERGLLSRSLAILILVTFLPVAGCDFQVVNPGPVQDDMLNDPATFESLVGGALRGAMLGLNSYSLKSVTLSREIQPSGSTGAAGVDHQVEISQFGLDVGHLPALGWNTGHEGRWIAQHAAERIREALGAEAASTSSHMARVHLWGGYADRILGEHVCHAVIDGGSPEPYTVHFERAVDQFTSAAEIAARIGDSETELAARSGRAAALMFLDRAGEAAADAAQIPADFVFRQGFTPGLVEGGARWEVGRSIDGVHRAISAWNTVYEGYYLETGDPRVAWGYDDSSQQTRYGEVARATFGLVPFYWPMKFYIPRGQHPDFRSVWDPNPEAQWRMPVTLSSGREMRLILAEAALLENRWQEAVSILNSLRKGLLNDHTGEPLELWNVAGLEEAWTAFKREHGIEMWLEGRRLGALRRWEESGTPGDLHPLEYTPQETVERFGAPAVPARCFPVPESERDQNPNVPMDLNP